VHKIAENDYKIEECGDFSFVPMLPDRGS